MPTNLRKRAQLLLGRWFDRASFTYKPDVVSLEVALAASYLEGLEGRKMGIEYRKNIGEYRIIRGMKDKEE